MELLSAIAELTNEPAEFHTRATPGWTFFSVPTAKGDPWPQDYDSEPVRIGANIYPEFFELQISEGDSTSERLEVTLGFEWDPVAGDFVLQAAHSFSIPLEEALERLFKIKTVEFWRRKALFHLAAYSNNDGRTMRPGHPSSWSESERAASNARLRSAAAMPGSSRRDRVTTQVLQQAAVVYREAWSAGRNPTQAVASHFHKSHSTAARWVGQARKIGILGPSDGSRGGEVEVPDE